MGLKYDLYLSRKPLAGFLVIGMAWASFFAQMPVIKANLGASDDSYGAILLISALGALAAMWLAPLADRLAGAFSLPVGAALVALGFFMAGASYSLVVFLIAMTLASAGSGIIDVLVNARIAGIEARSKRNLMNLNHGLYSFTYAGSALLTGAAREAGWSPSEVFVVLVVLILALCVLMYGRDNDTGIEDSADSTGSVSAVFVWLIGVIVLMAFLAEASTEGWSALHIERTLNGGAGEGALGPALLGLTMGIGRLSGHIVSRYIADRLLIGIALIVSGCGIALAASAQTILIAYAGFALGGLGISVVAPVALALLGRSVPPEARMKAISRASVVGYTAFCAGPPLMGFVSEGYGLRAGFYVVAVLLIVVAIMVVPLLTRHGKRA
jgi:MFS family permease